MRHCHIGLVELGSPKFGMRPGHAGVHLDALAEMHAHACIPSGHVDASVAVAETTATVSALTRVARRPHQGKQHWLISLKVL